MKKYPSTVIAPINGKPVKCITIREIRKCYSEWFNKNVKAVGNKYTHGVSPYVWMNTLGILPVAKDGVSARTLFVYDDFILRVNELGIESDDIVTDIEKNENIKDDVITISKSELRDVLMSVVREAIEDIFNK